MTNQQHIYTVAVTLVALTGCNIQFGWGDPCEQDQYGNFTNPAFNGLKPSEQTACKECGQIECGSGTGDTDGTGETVLELYLRDDAAGYSAPFGWLADTVPGMPVTNPVAVDADDCTSNSWPFPHVPDFNTAVRGDYSGPMSQWCARANEGFDGLHPITGPEWRVCTNAGGLSSFYNGGDQAYYPAAVVNDWITNPDQPGWSARMDCQEPSDLSAICDLGLVAVGGQDPSRPQEWTCECVSDVDCQLGAVCEAGWMLDGMFPQPTLCTWDDNASDTGGPSVYGLSDWNDGVTVNGTAITMTPAMLVAAIGSRAGLFNDAQSLDGELGSWTITGCEDTSLCAHLGLGVGDSIEFDIDEAGELIEGVTKIITVFRDESDTPETWSLTIAE